MRVYTVRESNIVVKLGFSRVQIRIQTKVVRCTGSCCEIKISRFAL